MWQNDLPIFNLVSSHLLACVAFVPIVIGLFFFMFAVFDDDYVIAFFFMVNLWLTETFTLIFVRTRPSTAFYGGFVGTYLFIFYGMEYGSFSSPKFLHVLSFLPKKNSPVPVFDYLA